MRGAGRRAVRTDKPLPASRLKKRCCAHNGLNQRTRLESNKLQRVELYNRTDCCAESLANFYVLVSDQPFGAGGLSAHLGNVNVTAISVAAIPIKSVL